MSVKLEDVAKRAGLSKATVSLALNGSERINSRTRAQVEALAREMGYHPNPYARRLVMQKSRMIGLIVPDIENVYYASLVRHVTDALNASGYGLSIATSVNSRLTERRIIGEMIDNRVDGLLLAPVNKPNDNPGYLDAADSAGVPVLFTTSLYEHMQRPCVMYDLYGGMLSLMEALHARNRKKITLLSGPENVYCLDLRERGYRDFIRSRNCDYENVVHLDDVSYEAAQKAMANMDGDFDAVVCVNDMMALGVVNALLAQGRRVPEEIAVAGYDDVIFSSVSPVPIATVRQDMRVLAACAVDMMLDLVQGRTFEEKDRLRLLPCELILRRSIGGDF